jgi:hypothetical protein
MQFCIFSLLQRIRARNRGGRGRVGSSADLAPRATRGVIGGAKGAPAAGAGRTELRRTGRAARRRKRARTAALEEEASPRHRRRTSSSTDCEIRRRPHDLLHRLGDPSPPTSSPPLNHQPPPSPPASHRRGSRGRASPRLAGAGGAGQGPRAQPPLSYGPPWAHYLGGYQDRLLGGPLGLPGLRYTAPDGVEHKDYGGEVLGYEVVHVLHCMEDS